MVAFNLTGEIDQMRRRHDLVLAEGGTCVMASINSVGLVGMIELGRHTQLPIHAHRNGWGALNRHPALGWEFTAWQKIWRLAGADHMHVNGIGNKFSEPDDSVVASAKASLTPMFEHKPCIAMPVFSSGQSAGAGLSDLPRTGLDRPDLRRRWRHSGPSRWARSRGCRSAHGMGRRDRWQGAARAMTGHLPLPDGPLVAFYGDDYTGSSAAMEALTFAGLPTILFLEPPTPERLAAAGQFRGIGIAGVARSKDPAWMERNLPPVFDVLAGIGAPIAHYKVCSTFDSAPHIGSIGRAIDLAVPRLGGAMASAARRIAGDGPLSGVRPSVRDREWRRPPPRPPSDHVAPSGDADGRVRSRPSSRAPDRATIGLVDFVTMANGGADRALEARARRGPRSSRSTCSTRRRWSKPAA